MNKRIFNGAYKTLVKGLRLMNEYDKTKELNPDESIEFIREAALALNIILVEAGLSQGQKTKCEPGEL